MMVLLNLLYQDIKRAFLTDEYLKIIEIILYSLGEKIRVWF